MISFAGAGLGIFYKLWHDFGVFSASIGPMAVVLDAITRRSLLLLIASIPFVLIGFVIEGLSYKLRKD